MTSRDDDDDDSAKGRREKKLPREGWDDLDARQQEARRIRAASAGRTPTAAGANLVGDGGGDGGDVDSAIVPVYGGPPPDDDVEPAEPREVYGAPRPDIMVPVAPMYGMPMPPERIVRDTDVLSWGPAFLRRRPTPLFIAVVIGNALAWSALVWWLVS